MVELAKERDLPRVLVRAVVGRAGAATGRGRTESEESWRVKLGLEGFEGAHTKATASSAFSNRFTIGPGTDVSVRFANVKARRAFVSAVFPFDTPHQGCSQFWVCLEASALEAR